MQKNEAAIDMVSKFMERAFISVLEAEEEAEAAKQIRIYEFLDELKTYLKSDECPKMN